MSTETALSCHDALELLRAFTVQVSNVIWQTEKLIESLVLLVNCE